MLESRHVSKALTDGIPTGKRHWSAAEAAGPPSPLHGHSRTTVSLADRALTE